MLMPTILSTEYFISILTVKSIHSLNVYLPHIIGSRYIHRNRHVEHVWVPLPNTPIAFTVEIEKSEADEQKSLFSLKNC
jgi:predicted thioesterase